jgi:hypothetical protein
MEMINRSGVVVKSAHARFLGGCGSLHTRTRRTTGEQRRLVETVKHRAPEPAFSVLLTEVIWLTNHPGSWRSATVTVLTFSPFVFVACGGHRSGLTVFGNHARSGWTGASMQSRITANPINSVREVRFRRTTLQSLCRLLLT